jgi:hypothetical protein
MHFREIFGVYCENDTKHINAGFCVWKKMGHIALTVFYRVIACGSFKFHDASLVPNLVFKLKLPFFFT